MSFGDSLVVLVMQPDRQCDDCDQKRDPDNAAFVDNEPYAEEADQVDPESHGRKRAMSASA